MFSFTIRRIVIGVAAFGALSSLVRQTIGDDFRVENAVYQANESAPSCRSTTIFHGGMVYDCMDAPAETVVFDRAADRFVLLNLKKRVRTELTTTQLADLIDLLHSLGAKSKDPVVNFLAEPKFQEGIDEATGQLVLSSPSVTYRVVLAPESNPNIVQQYHEFCDYYTRLNSILTPGARPPFGRLVVNAAIAQHQATALKVLLSIVNEGKDASKTEVRSEHRVVTPLVPADLDRIKQTQEQMGSFKLVGFHQYRKTALK